MSTPRCAGVPILRPGDVLLDDLDDSTALLIVGELTEVAITPCRPGLGLTSALTTLTSEQALSRPGSRRTPPHPHRSRLHATR